MFFRNQKQHILTYDERMSALPPLGFQVNDARVSRNGLSAEVKPSGDAAEIGAIGVLVGSEVGELTDLGYQKIWMTPSGKRLPATAAQLKALHAFVEDLREGLGLTSLYNEGLGTVNEHHLYDRVVDRDVKRGKHAWEVSFR